MNELKNNLLKKISILFLFFQAVIFLSKFYLLKWGFDFWFLLIGNIFLYLIFIISTLIHSRAAVSSNTHVFLRSINLTMILKMFGCAIAVLIFVMANGGEINKQSIFTLMFLYLIYTAVEVSTLMRALKKKNV